MDAPSGTNFSLPFVQDSLDESLRRLRTDHVDVLLLHEARIEDITDELLRFLDAAVASGKVGTYGVATEAVHAAEIEARNPGVFPILQTEWSLLSPERARSAAFSITHRCILPALSPLLEVIRADAKTAAALSGVVDLDLTNPDALVQVLVAAALAQNPTGVVLVSSKDPSRLARLGAMSRDDDFISKANAITQPLKKMFSSAATK